ncbi:DNA internalization-related competence protein ComEC/Rec2 [Congregibacter litoralis]|uniref:DNA internalization-related protein competence protein ComEC/Rec2 n=1 Tax=Congregibacter litoralis KT71 TaxID=314285 RepID=A4A8A4_9GAMM|nr:DNA internalization-related competence protein ComEC/Rec2 [Congregibacter litoralis]EAQ97899.2 DNA internalization-related protein competence protein ComEC/Rec2 [Congregibacter litoralis KT71]
MVAPYPLMLLSLAVGLGALQLPVLPRVFQVICAASGMALIVFLALRSVDSLNRPAPPHWVSRALVLTGVILLILIPALITAFQWQTRQLSPLCQREHVTIDGRIDGLVQRLPGPRNIHRLHIRVGQLEPRRCAGPRRIRVYLDTHRLGLREEAQADEGAGDGSPLPIKDLKPGSRIRFEAVLRQPRGMVNPAALDGEKGFLVAGIHAVGSLRSVSAVDPSLDGIFAIKARIDRLRAAVSSSLRNRVSGRVGALLAALAVGDRRFMTAETWSRLRMYGLTHLMVVSGLHISMIAVPGWYFGAALGRIGTALMGRGSATPFLAPSCAMLFAGSYAFLSGMALPAQRALLMLSLLMLPRSLGRNVKATEMLPIAAMALFLLNPVSLLAASFWLTLGAVGLLLWFTSWRGRSSWLRDLWDAQGYMLLAMLPLGLFWFQEAGSIGAVVNLVAVPLTTFLVVPLLLCAVVLAPLWYALADHLLEWAAIVLATLWSALEYWEPMLGPWGVLRVSPGNVQLFLALFGVVILALPRFPGRIFSVGLLLVPLSIPDSRGDDFVELLFFDVGQGTAVLLRQRDKALLYDTGGGPVGGPSVASRTIVPALQSMGIRELDTLIISHDDRDHDAGEGDVARMASPQQLRRAVVSGSTGEACRLGGSQRFSPGVTLRFLSQHLPGDSDNNGSCVILISIHGRKFLLPGDIDSAREREILRYWGQDLTADVLLAGHHGSGSSSSRLWLRSLAPEVLIVTAGHGNRFGHPAQRVLDSAAASDIVLLNTALRGAISFRVFPDGRMKCRTLRHRKAAFWRRGDFQRDCRPP